MNDVLGAINFRVKALNITNGSTWSVVHPTGGLPFQDNMVIEATDPNINCFRVDAILNKAQECGILCYQFLTSATRPALSNPRVPSQTNPAPINRNGNPQPEASSSAQPTAKPPPPTHTRMLLNSAAVKQIAPVAAIPTAITPFPPAAPADSKPDEDESDQCVICMSGKKENVAIPCGHSILCSSCSENEKLMKALTTCPICRQKMECIVYIG